MDVPNDRIPNWAVSDQDVVHGRTDRCSIDADSTGRVALGIAVYQQGSLLRGGETRRKIHSGRRLSDSTLLIRDGDYAGHWLTEGFGSIEWR